MICFVHKMTLERLIGQAGDDYCCDAAFAFRSVNSFHGIPQWLAPT